MRALAIVALLGLAACAQASPIMDTGDGTYMVSARAAPARGGATGAQTVAYQEAQKFCTEQGGGRPVVIGADDRDVYQSSMGGGFTATRTSASGGFGGTTMAAGEAKIRFRCQR